MNGGTIIFIIFNSIIVSIDFYTISASSQQTFYQKHSILLPIYTLFQFLFQFQMKIFIAQQNYHIGNFDNNLTKIIDAIAQAKAQNGDLIIFPELAICGYPPRDLLGFSSFLQQCYVSIEKIKSLTQNIAVLIGAPSPNPVPEGKDLFNSAYFIYQNEVQQIIHKTHLPNYDVFDEYRYFESANEWNVVHFKGKKIAVTICEDIWDISANPMYRKQPLDMLLLQQPELIINLSASPFDYTHESDRDTVLKINAQKYNLPIIYCNAVGSQTEIVFDGGSLVFDAAGNQVKKLPLFKEALDYVVWNGNPTFEHLPAIINASEIPNNECNPLHLQPALNIDKVHDALVYGIKEYFTKMGFTKAIVSSSGGIDSAVTLALACRALGSENVFAVLQPSQYSSDHSVSDAVQLSKNLNSPYDIIYIEKIFHAFAEQLSGVFKETKEDVTEENLQSRIRGTVAMALSNKFNYILLNTSNKSELATGYGTLYGDMAGGLGVLGDVYKMQVYELARYINKDQEIIPENIIAKVPSAELRPNQKDSDSLPEYDILDAILYQFIEQGKSKNEIVAAGYVESVVQRILRLVNINEYKRNQFCPIIRISPKAFGIGRRVPIVAKHIG